MSAETAPAAAPVADTAPAAPPVDTTIKVDASQYTRILSELEQFRASHAAAEAKRQADLDAAEQRRLAELAEKEGVAAALKKQAEEFRSKYEAESSRRAEIERAVVAEKKAAALNTGLLKFNQPLVSDVAAEQLGTLLDARFDATREDGKVVVRDRITGRPAADVLPELLASPAYSHFFRATQAGGSGSPGGATPPPTPAPETPKNLGAYAIEQIKAAMAAGQPVPTFFGGTSFFPR